MVDSIIMSSRATDGKGVVMTAGSYRFLGQVIAVFGLAAVIALTGLFASSDTARAQATPTPTPCGDSDGDTYTDCEEA